MNDQLIGLEPEIIVFGSDNKSLIKIMNRTANTVSNCFFCLFNTNKYQFNPQSFKLDPWEHRIITVTLLTKNNDYKQQFAYIKSKNFSKRITFLCNNMSTPDQRLIRSPSSGLDELYTLSSRDYKDTQKAAYDRVIAQKQAYIKRLQRRLQQQEQSNRKERTFTSQGKTKNYYARETQQLENKIQTINQQRQNIITQNRQLKQRLHNLQSLLVQQNKDTELKQITKIMQKKEEQLRKLKEDIQYLEVQCQGLYSTISQKEQTIRKLGIKNSEIVNQIMKDNQKRLKQLQIKIDEEKKKYDKQYKGYKEKIGKLEKKLNQSQIVQNRKNQLEQQIDSKETALANLQAKLENEKKKRKQYQQQKKKSLKINSQNDKLVQQNNLLKSKVQVLQKSIDDLKQQTFLYKSKIVQEPDKASRYLEVALQSCRNENQILKKSKIEIQQSLVQQTKSRKHYESKLSQMLLQMKNLKQQIARLYQQKQQIEAKSRISRDESHQTMMKLRSQNIDLIQKMSFKNKLDENIQKQLKQSQLKLQQSQQQLKKIKNQQRFMIQKLRESEEEKSRINKQVQKYKKQTKKQLKNITQSTLDELKKVKQQKKQLKQKIQFLQKQINVQKQRQQTATKLDSLVSNLKVQTRTRYPASQTDRRTGIKNQRKQIEQSNYYSKNQSDLENIYYELGQLREFKNFINLQIKKIQYQLNLRQSYQNDKNSIFCTINVFETIQKKIADILIDQQKFICAEKQVEFLKGRLTQLQTLSKYTKINDTIEEKYSAIELNRVNQGDRKLLQLVRQEMKNQYRKMQESLRISQDKFEILKKKIYEQYRLRFINILNSKQKLDNVGKILKIQAVLQRFVDGLGNKSHKQAILAKQIKLKQQARKQAGSLKQKVGYLNQLLDQKKGYCTRQPIKVYNCENQMQWHDNIRLEAKMLTYEAENARLLQEIDFYKTENKSAQQELKLCFADLENKEQEIIKLKQQIVQIESASAKQLLRRQQELDDLQKKYIQGESMEFKNDNKINRDKQYLSLRQDIERKKEIIQNLKQKQRMLEQLLQSSNRSSDQARNKNKKDLFEDLRVQQSLKQFKQNNRQLRTQNSRLKQQINNLKQQIQRKNMNIKRLKGQGEQSRIKVVKHDQEEIQKLRVQIRQLKAQLTNSKLDLQKIKKKKEKQKLQFQSELKRAKNQHLIEKSSLESIIRALSDSIQRLYSDLSIVGKKKGVTLPQQINFQQLFDNPSQIDSLKVYQCFEQVISAISKT